MQKDDKPLYKIAKSHGVSPVRVQQVAREILSAEEYDHRSFVCRRRGGLVVGELHKKRWREKKKPDSPIFKKGPNKLELLLGGQIVERLSSVSVRYNVWKTLRDVDQKCYVHLETDIAFYVGSVRFCVLCDGEAFHGKKSYFRGDTVSEDERRSQILFKYNPIVLRYSETEIKNGLAIKDIEDTVQKVLVGTHNERYRNWMLADHA